MAELRLSINLDKVPNGQWRKELTGMLRTLSDQLDAGHYATPNDLPTVALSDGTWVGGWSVVLWREPAPSGQGVLCNQRPSLADGDGVLSVHICDAPIGHSDGPHFCRCGYTWPK